MLLPVPCYLAAIAQAIQVVGCSDVGREKDPVVQVCGNLKVPAREDGATVLVHCSAHSGTEGLHIKHQPH